MNRPETEKVKISVVIPAYNSAQSIERAVNSVLAQTRPPEEIIVVDDGSVDNTADILKSFGDKVKYIRQENAGASCARNTGINAAAGNWIAFLDADDEWLPKKLELQTNALGQNPDAVWCTGNFYRCLCDQKRRALDINTAKITPLVKTDGSMDFFKAFLRDAYGCTDTVIVKKDVLLEAGRFYPSQTLFDDMDLWLRIAYLYPEIIFVNEPLAVYHMSTKSLSQHNYPVSLYADFIQRHLKLSTESQHLDVFQPCAGHLLSRWLRAMLFDGRADDIRSLIKQFDSLLSVPYKTLMKTLTVCPRVTASACRALSKVIQTLNLRAKPYRPPKKSG